MHSQENPVYATCPLCHAEMVQRDGRFGVFLACSRYPECRGKLGADAAWEQVRRKPKRRRRGPDKHSERPKRAQGGAPVTP